MSISMLTRFSKTFKTLLLASAVLAPAVTLALLGLRAQRAETALLRERFRQDQAAIVRLVGDRISDVARKALEDLEERCRTGDPDAALEQRFTAVHAIARHIFLVRDGVLIYPPPVTAGSERGRDSVFPGGHLVTALDVENYVSRLREGRRLARLVRSGIEAEQGDRPAAALRLYRRGSQGRGDLTGQALLGLARVQRRLGQRDDALRTYRELRRQFEGRADSEGTAYALMADAGQAEIGPVSLLLKIHERLIHGEYLTSSASRRFYLRWSIDQLSRRGGIAPRILEDLRRRTAHLFASVRFGTLLIRHGIPDLPSLDAEQVGGIALDRNTILVVRQREDLVVGYALAERYLQHLVARHQREVVPQGRGLELSLQRLGAMSALHPERILHTSALAPPLSSWTLTAAVPAGGPLELFGRREGLLRRGLVLGLILVLLVGLILTYLGVRRESELARLKSDFASNVSHELKTPLTSIRMYAEMLQEGIASTGADRERYQGVIIRESERLGRLIANVLDFSQVERGTRRYDLRAEDVEAMVREAVDTMARLADGEKISIRLQVPPPGTLPPVTADRESAIQSILNLLSNAAKYSLAAPEIEVELRAEGAAVALLVRDHGIGIPPSEQRRIFEDFYRAPGARQAGVEGTGLGLALVRRHMTACGGRVEVESVPGKGSCFTLWFAAAPPQKESASDVAHSGD